MTRRHMSTDAERAELIAAGWTRDEADWWWVAGNAVGFAWTAVEALRRVRRKYRTQGIARGKR